ncbi:MAG: type II toxin-antitoxin system VapC family toxin [Candidatus Micrarchaeota archaeon]|nr:type II toxin-antitoxin system VapC family toxin [Candidatus Micrarchaeota archaeon]
MILLDTSFIIANSSERDRFHSRALAIEADIGENKHGEPIMTDYIFDEVVTTTLARTGNLKRAIEMGQMLLDTVTMVKIDLDIFEESWRIFKSQKNARLSFTDCTIIATCRMNGITSIATFDGELKRLSGLKIVD